jgi:predicted transcriptional regulator of viral defense system
MKGLSGKEMEIVSYLEFEKKYFFKRGDIARFLPSYNQMRHTLHKLIKKGRIISLSRNKYYLVPIKAKSGKWAEDSFMLIDEAMNGKDYFIGGWAAANYWKLSDQVPMKIDIYTTKRQGKKDILSTSFIFHRTSKKRIEKAVIEKIGEHLFKIMNRDEVKKWMRQRK